jgi:hypothetical protein
MPRQLAGIQCHDDEMYSVQRQGEVEHELGPRDEEDYRYRPIATPISISNKAPILHNFRRGGEERRKRT